MARKDKEQSASFIKKAKELGSDESGGLFERAFRRLVSPTPANEKRIKPENKSKDGK